MRTIDELGISPAPWKIDDKWTNVVNDAKGEWLEDNNSENDARLISAAPELYNELRTALRWIECHDIYGTMARDILRDGYAALAKAGGEEVAK